MEVKEKGNRGAGDETPYSLSSSNHTNNPSEGKGSIEAKEGDTTAAQTASSRSLHTSDDARRASRISTITPSVLLKADSIREEDLETILDTAEDYSPYDFSGQKAYTNACKRYKALPSSSFFKNLADSEVINMAHYGMGPKGVKALSIPMVINSNITCLNLKNNNLGREGLDQIVKMMLENSSITDLNLSENDLGELDADLIPEMLQANQYIKRLDISANGLTDKFAKPLSRSIEGHTSLNYINLSHNHFGSIGGKAFKRMIAENGVLREIDLSWNEIRMAGAQAISKGVKENIGLKDLNISWNGFTDDGAVAMAEALTVNGTLVNLDMSSNRIKGAGFLALCTSLKQNTALRRLLLGRNLIPEDAAIAGLKKIYRIPELQLQVLDITEISFCNTRQVSQEIGHLQAKHRDLKCKNAYTDSYGQRKKVYNPAEDALVLMANYVQENHMTMVDLFSQFDKDGSMSVTHDEFKEGLRQTRIPLSSFMIDELIKLLDKDKDGEIDFSELVIGAEEQLQQRAKDQQRY